jgi:hypothetical protein
MSQDQQVKTVQAPAGPLPRAGRRRWWASLLLAAAIFVSGAVVGGGLMMVGIVHRVRYAIHHPESAADRFAKRLKSKLDLTDEQAARVRSILARRQAALQTIRADVQPRVEAELDLARREISAELTPRQQPRWQAYFDDLHRQWMPPPPASQAVNQ